MKYFLISALSLSVLIACKSAEEVVSNEVPVQVEDALPSNTISLQYMDLKVKPQDDFFMYANGTWIKNNPVPPSESRWGSFNELDQSNMKKLTAILEHAKDFGIPKDGTKLIGDYYASYTNMSKRNELGIKPIQPYLAKIEGLSQYSGINEIIAMQHDLGIQSLFRFGVSQDIKDVEKHIVSFGQGGLTLPNRDYYTDPEKEDIRKAYQVYISDILQLAGKDAETADMMALHILKFEYEMASNMLKPADMRDPENRYHKMPKAKGFEVFGNFNFSLYVDFTGIGAFDSINIGQPEYAAAIGDLMVKKSVDDWRYYLYWKMLNHYVPHLDEAFVARHFAFYGKTLSGTSEMKPINERAIREITGMEFGELLGRAFVEQHYSTADQESINSLVDNLLLVFQERIKGLEWMSDETKEQALKKLNAIGRKLGFPDKWTDFSALKFNPEDYIGNINRAEKHSYKENLAKLKQPVNKDEWGMPAHMVNAYYHPLLNEIAFPAGIMQPPFFSAHFEDAVNYGRIGMVIGHEFTHGFDDNGSKFDASGNFNNWWTESDRTLFVERTTILGNTFDGFCPIDGHCVNSQLTMGENIADLGGLTLTYYAYSRTEEFKSGVEINGFTPAQRFFIAYAQLWKMNFTDEELKKRIATDPHSPGMYRVNGPLMNCPEFFEAFDVKEGDPMRNPKGKVAKIW